jgi:methylmalonyl-CoA mutase N-terminal domain/subunit
VADSIDPLAGSYLIEHLTDEVERRAQAYLDQIDGIGGALAAIERGFVQQEIADAAYAYQQAVERGEQTIVGVNQFQAHEERHMERLRIDAAIEIEQCRCLAELRRTRDNSRVAELRGQLETAARRHTNLMPLFVECVENHVTLGEICGTLRGVWGEYRPSVGI